MKIYETENLKVGTNKRDIAIYFKQKIAWSKATEVYRQEAIKKNDTKWLMQHPEYKWCRVLSVANKKEMSKLLPILIKELEICYESGEVIE